MEEDFIGLLLGAPGVASIVAERISWAVQPQGEIGSAIILHLVSRPQAYTMESRDRLAGSLVQINCKASSFAEAKALARAVTAALDALPAGAFQGAFVENERTHFEPAEGPQANGDSDIHMTSLDVRVWWREP